MSRSCKRIVKDYDIFGHPVSLKFNQNGSHHRTCCGGCLSIILYIVGFAMLCLRLTDLNTIVSSITTSILINEANTTFKDISLE